MHVRSVESELVQPGYKSLFGVAYPHCSSPHVCHCGSKGARRAKNVVDCFSNQCDQAVISTTQGCLCAHLMLLTSMLCRERPFKKHSRLKFLLMCLNLELILLVLCVSVRVCASVRVFPQGFENREHVHPVWSCKGNSTTEASWSLEQIWEYCKILYMEYYGTSAA